VSCSVGGLPANAAIHPLECAVCAVTTIGMSTHLQATVNVLCMLGTEFVLFLYFNAQFTVADTWSCAGCKMPSTVGFIVRKGAKERRQGSV
jgi:hypothetical protein